MGFLYRGTKGVMVASGASGVPRLLPEDKMQAYKLPPKSLERRSGIYEEWHQAVMGGENPSEHWPDCAVPLTELVLLGCIAIRAGGYLQWNGEAMEFTNSDTANKLLKPEYHNGWKLV